MVTTETQRDNKLTTKKAQILYKHCIGCGKCIDVCDVNAIPGSFLGYISIYAEIEADLCTGCGECLLACKYDAITLGQ